MSTRAIIAIPVKGGYETAWNWCDGYPSNLGRELKRYFNTDSLARELVALHSFTGICGKRQKAEMQAQFRVPETEYRILSNGRYARIEPHQGKTVTGEGENGFYSNVEDMLQEDINYVYVFSDGTWKTYK